MERKRQKDGRHPDRLTPEKARTLLLESLKTFSDPTQPPATRAQAILNIQRAANKLVQGSIPDLEKLFHTFENEDPHIALRGRAIILITFYKNVSPLRIKEIRMQVL